MTVRVLEPKMDKEASTKELWEGMAVFYILIAVVAAAAKLLQCDSVRLCATP